MTDGEKIRLTPYEASILRALYEDGGFATGRVVEIAFGRRSSRSESARARAILERLEGRRLVRRLDDRKPIAWVRTDAGRAALSNAAGEAS